MQLTAYQSSIAGNSRETHLVTDVLQPLTSPRPALFIHQGGLSFLNFPNDSRFYRRLRRCIESRPDIGTTNRPCIYTREHVNKDGSLENESETDATMNKFLSRFIRVMWVKLSLDYPDNDINFLKKFLEGVVQNFVSEIEKGGIQQFTDAVPYMPNKRLGEIVWKDIWEVSRLVKQEMLKEKEKERMKSFPQSEEVKQDTEKEKNKESMKSFLQSEEVKQDMEKEKEKERMKSFPLKLEEIRRFLQPEEVKQDMEKEKEKERMKRLYQTREAMGRFFQSEEVKQESMKSFLQSEEVKQMYRFAGQVGIRGELLRELKFKWAHEKTEHSNFYECLELLYKESNGSDELGKENAASGSLPKRHGKIKYKVYGLDLSDQKWAMVADNIHESGEVMWPKEAKPILGKCKIVTEKILSLQEEDDPAPLLREWSDLLEPSRIDWIALLDKLKDSNSHLYYKIAESVFSEESFQASIHDYSKLIDALAKENCMEDVERILKKMSVNGIQPDDIMLALLIQMYCISGNLVRADESFDALRAQGFMLYMKAYNSMIIAYINAGRLREAAALFKDMEMKDIKVTEKAYMSLFKALAKGEKVDAAERIFQSRKFCSSHILESWTIMIEAYARVGKDYRARCCFNDMMELGHKPDDLCISIVISVYEKTNSLNEALNLLLELEKNGFELGVSTYTILVDWFTKLELFNEAEEVLDKISEQREAPPFKLHISLCDMYSKSGADKKALQALRVLESNYKQLEFGDFKRIINSLEEGGFQQDARRLREKMKALGFVSCILGFSQATRHSNKRKVSPTKKIKNKREVMDVPTRELAMIQCWLEKAK